MATRISNLRCFPLQYPSHGRLVVRSITRAMLPGSAPSTLRDVSSVFNFNPMMLILSLPMTAFSFFSAKLAGVDYGARPEIAYQLAFAFNQFYSRGCPCGLSLSVVLETIYQLEEPRPRADFLDEHLVLNDTASSMRDYNEEFDDYLFDLMLRNFDSMGVDDETLGMSDREISELKKERLTGEEEEGESCSICLEEFTRGAVITPLLPCSHRFHNGCIVQWLRSNRTCPNCRGKCN